jgi:Acetyltransferases
VLGLTGVNFTLRSANENDIPAIHRLVGELREFHGRDPSLISLDKIRKYGFGTNPKFNVELAEVDKKIVGMAIYYIGWAGLRCDLSLRLEDLYVQRDYRGSGIGTALFKKVVKEGVDKECAHLVFDVSTWNAKALEFYQNLGAKKENDVCVVRMDGPEMTALAKKA